MFSFFMYYYDGCRALLSFPTRRSSDLSARLLQAVAPDRPDAVDIGLRTGPDLEAGKVPLEIDRQRGPQRGEAGMDFRSEEHTSELQSRGHLVCRLLLEKKNFILNNLLT